MPSESVYATETDIRTHTGENKIILSESKLGLIQADRDMQQLRDQEDHQQLRDQEDHESPMEAT